MATSLYKAQFALILCAVHDKKELYAYCKTCRKKICSSCIKGDLALHDWETITDILKEKKRGLPEECKEISDKILPSLRKEITHFDRKMSEEDIRLEHNKFVLNDSRQSHIDRINLLFDRRIDECNEKSHAAMKIYKENRDILKEKVEYLETMTTALDKDINTLPDNDILDMEKEMRDELEKALSYSADKYTRTTVFVPGQVNAKALEDMISGSHHVFLEEKEHINIYSSTISSVKLFSDTNALVGIYGDRYFKVLEGINELKTLKTPCFDGIVSNTGYFALGHENRCTVSIFSQEEEKIRTIDTKPIHPTYISKTENDDILVTLRDGGSDYDLVPTSRRIVQRMTLEGKVLNTYEFREDDKTRLFTLPGRTTENKNSEICVVNRIRRDNAEIVVLCKDGSVKCTFRGEGLGLGFEKFLPYDVECDSKCHILFSELSNKGIHMISAEGIHIMKLFQYEQIQPTVISIHGDNLWCGFNNGQIKVFKYTN